MISFPIAERWSSMGKSIFSEMTSLSKKFNAINLGQGAPDFYGPHKILDAICTQMQTCHNQYAPAAGEFALRENLVPFIQKYTGVSYDPITEMTITCGASEALFCTLNAYLQPGDRVVLFEPAYDLYAQAIANTGAEIVPVPLIPPTFYTKEWSVDWDAFEAAKKLGFKCIIINTPHNPTGKIFNKEEIIRIGEGALQNQAMIIADEVYENLSFEKECPFVSVASFPELKDITVRISSAAKTFGFTGLKLGWATAPKHFTHSLRLVHQSTVFCLNPALQLGLADCLADETWLSKYLLEQKTEYLEKRDILKSILEQKGFLVPTCYGTFFLCGNFKNLATHNDSIRFAKEFVEFNHIATIPLASFYKNQNIDMPWVRFAFCKKNETLTKLNN